MTLFTDSNSAHVPSEDWHKRRFGFSETTPDSRLICTKTFAGTPAGSPSTGKPTATGELAETTSLTMANHDEVPDSASSPK